MGDRILHSSAWALTRRQHGVVTRRQLLELGLGPRDVTRRIGSGRLHPVWRGVYAVGRPELAVLGLWMAAVLACGPRAVLSHRAAAALWGIRPWRGGSVDVSVPAGVLRRRPGIALHRRRAFGDENLTRRHGIPVTRPPCTLVDLATCLGRPALEAAIGEADRRDLVDPEALLSALDGALRGRPGAGVLREILGRATFRLTDSGLEQLFLPLARQAGLPLPRTQAHVNGFRVDFHWPELGLVVETDGLRYHRTPAQQAVDRLRDQTHAAAGLTSVRFTHAQVAYEPEHVIATLVAVAARLGRVRRGAGPR